MSAKLKRGRNRNQPRRFGKPRAERMSEPMMEQPTAESAGTVPCKLCGHLVHPRRMHFHMVRVHGATFRSKNG